MVSRRWRKACTSAGADTTRYIHSPRGIHTSESPTGAWSYASQDGLGSVRGYADANTAALSTVNYSPYGVPDVAWDGFAFTGELRDSNTLQYHRARYYSPGMGVWVSLDPLETPNRYAYVGGDVVNRVDGSGYLPCERPKGSGAFDSDCINKIIGSLQTDANNAELLGILAPTSGSTTASRLLWHYLGNSGATKIIPYDWFDPTIHNDAGEKIDKIIRESDFFINLCSSGCCGPTGKRSESILIPNISARGKRFFEEAPDWWNSLPNLIKDNKGSIQTRLHPSETQYLNPFYAAFGGVSVNNITTSELNVENAGSISKISIHIPVEYYDYYDWCFGDNQCFASGTHPFDKRVGHFISLEEVEKGKPFSIYSYANIILDYEISCVGNAVNVLKRSWKSEPFMMSDFASIKPVHLAKDNSLIGRNTPRFIDDWPDDPEFPLFPTTDQLPPN